MPAASLLHNWYLFWLGAAAGLTILAMTAYLGVSPRWLKWLLLASGALVISRYVTMALFATSAEPQRLWGLRACWYGTSVGLTLPALVAIDQLIRHPAMTPKKLLLRFAPFLVAYGMILFLGNYELVADRVVGMRPQFIGWAVWVLSLVQGCFVLGLLGFSTLLIRKLPIRRIQLALLGLMAAFVYLGVDGIVTSLGWWYFRPFLFSEITALAAIWFAFHTARSSVV